MNDGPKSRMRLKFARLKEAGPLSHLEQIKAFRIVAMASGLKCWPAKAGSGSVPKMSFGPAISVGYESTCEYADLYLEDFVKAVSPRWVKISGIFNPRGGITTTVSAEYKAR